MNNTGDMYNNIDSKEKFDYMFEKNNNDEFIRLIIPSSFVQLFDSNKESKDLDLRGKKPTDLTTEEVIIMKKYAYECSQQYMNKGNLSDFDREMMKKYNIDSNINTAKDLSKAIDEKKKEMLIEECDNQAQKICNDFGFKLEDFYGQVEDDINAVVYIPKVAQRGISGFIIADDGSYDVFGSIKPFDSYLEDFKNKYKSKYTNSDESLKLSNGKYAADEETKEAFDNYMQEVNDYNSKVESGEKTNTSLGDILNKYNDTFYDEGLEKKQEQIKQEFDSKEKDTKIDDLISDIDKKIENLEKNERKDLEEMEIIVQGKAVDYIAPDEVIININFITKGMAYESALSEGIANVQKFVDEILVPNNFNKEDMKTRSFVVREETKYDEITRTYEKNGFSYNQSAILKFDYNKELLAKIMVSLSQLSNPPMCNINFGVKNEKECRKIVLAKAYEEAKNQAEAIATAAGKVLKGCKKVDFEPFTTEYVSNARFGSDVMYEKSAALGTAQMVVNNFTPEDIQISETLYCLWIAE